MGLVGGFWSTRGIVSRHPFFCVVASFSLHDEVAHFLNSVFPRARAMTLVSCPASLRQWSQLHDIVCTTSSGVSQKIVDFEDRPTSDPEAQQCPSGVGTCPSPSNTSITRPDSALHKSRNIPQHRTLFVSTSPRRPSLGHTLTLS